MYIELPHAFGAKQLFVCGAESDRYLHARLACVVVAEIETIAF